LTAPATFTANRYRALPWPFRLNFCAMLPFFVVASTLMRRSPQ
jgi:hypothetical protein